MPTENPKISAYVPQVVYDKFLEFKSDKNISMSQAATLVFAEFFGVDLSNSSEPQSFTSGLPDRVKFLEEQFELLIQRVDLVQSTSKPLESSDIPKVSATQEDKRLDSKSGYRQTEITDILVSDNNSSDDIDSLLSRLNSRPLKGKMLSLRLGMNPSVLSTKKGKLKDSPTEFEDWLQSKDVDSVRWCLIAENGKFKGYAPVDDTSEDKLVLLSQWLKKFDYEL